MKTIKEVARQQYEDMIESGFRKRTHERMDDKSSVVCLALIHTEVSEAVEEIRSGKIEGPGMAFELADIVLRTFDLAEGLNIDIEEAILVKMEMNRGRKRKHGKLF